MHLFMQVHVLYIQMLLILNIYIAVRVAMCISGIHQGFIQDFELGGEQDGSRMIVCKSTLIYIYV